MMESPMQQLLKRLIEWGNYALSYYSKSGSLRNTPRRERSARKFILPEISRFRRNVCFQHLLKSTSFIEHQMKTELEQAQEDAMLWREEAKRWRDMYLEYDEMLEGHINDAVKRLDKVWQEIDQLKKQIEDDIS